MCPLPEIAFARRIGEPVAGLDTWEVHRNSELDHEAIALVGDWIVDALPLREDYTAWRLAEFGSTNSPQGEAGFDADEDGATNYEEYVGGTDPLDDMSYLVSEMSTDGNSATVKFSMPAYRSAHIMAANDLNGPWERWNAPGNNGIMRPPGLTSITGLASDETRFFRLVMEER